MAAVDLEAYVARSRAVDLAAFPWDDVPRYPVTPEAIRTLRYMQDIESHTIIYLRELLATRAVEAWIDSVAGRRPQLASMQSGRAQLEGGGNGDGHP